MVLPVPFGPAMPMRSPRRMRIEKSLTMARAVVTLADAFASMTSAPDGAAEPAGDNGIAGTALKSAALFAQRLQLAEPAHVSLSSPVTP